MSFLNPFGNTPAKAAAAAGRADTVMRSGAGSPLELIKYDQSTGKFHLDEEAIAVLQNVKGPVGVVAVCGRARQGKSFILNQLLGQSTGFVVAPTHRPCTKGLWMWSSPVERKSADGSSYHLVLLDTEGIDAYDQTGQYSTQIFSLAVLLSSLLVYNQMGGIDEAALDRLSLVTEVSKNVRVRAGDASGDAELAEFNPAFLWLLRDFYLELEEDGRKLTPREYLETALRDLPGAGPAVDAKNAIRESIKSLFPNRDCFSLVRPMSDEAQLTRLDSIPPEQLRPQFVEGIRRLTRLIFMRAQPKRLGNQLITGSLLAALAGAYVDAINKGAVPTIATAWQGVAEAGCRKAAEAAEEAYVGAFNAAAGNKEGGLEAEHARCLAIARRVFAEDALGDAEVVQANEARFLERLEARFQQARQQWAASTEAECRKLIAAITSHLTQLANKEGTTLAELEAPLREWEASYRDAPNTTGPAKWQLHAEFLQGTYRSIVTGLARRQEHAAEAARNAATAQVARLQRELEALQASQQQAAARVASLERELQTAKEAHTKEVQRLRAEADTRASTEIGAAKNAAAQQLRETQSQLEQARQEAQSLKQQLQAAAAKGSSAVADLQSQAQQLERATAEIASLKGQVTAAATEKQQAASEIAELKAQLASRPVAGADDMEAEGYGTPEEDTYAHVVPSSMTINEIKDWLTEHGHENVVWQLTQAKAKKPRYVEEVNKVLGRT